MENVSQSRKWIQRIRLNSTSTSNHQWKSQWARGIDEYFVPGLWFSGPESGGTGEVRAFAGSTGSTLLSRDQQRPGVAMDTAASPSQTRQTRAPELQFLILFPSPRAAWAASRSVFRSARNGTLYTFFSSGASGNDSNKAGSCHVNHVTELCGQGRTMARCFPMAARKNTVALIESKWTHSYWRVSSSSSVHEKQQCHNFEIKNDFCTLTLY